MSQLANRVRKHIHKHPRSQLATPGLRVPLSTDVIVTAIDALALRARWYERRLYDVPADVTKALRVMCAAVGLDPDKVGGPS